LSFPQRRNEIKPTLFEMQQTKAQKAAAKILAKKQAAAAAAGGDDKPAAASKPADVEEKKTHETDRHVTGVLSSRPASKDVKISSFCLSAYGTI
jgi:hypothetical protein